MQSNPTKSYNITKLKIKQHNAIEANYKCNLNNIKQNTLKAQANSYTYQLLRMIWMNQIKQNIMKTVT